MSNENKTLASQILTSSQQNDEEEEEEEEIELEKLEADVNQMADKIVQYRATLPDQFKSTLASTIASLRPLISTRFTDGSDPGPSLEPNLVATSEPLQAVEDEETNEKLELLKRKMSSNAASMPIVLKRMKDCIPRIDKLDSQNGTIHPGFKRKR